MNAEDEKKAIPTFQKTPPTVTSKESPPGPRQWFVKAKPCAPSRRDRARLAKMTESDLFLRLFLQNERRIFAYIMTLLPIRPDVDDVFQEVSLMMWNKFDESQPPADFAAWGCRIAYFKVLEFCKKHRRDRVLFSQDFVERIAETAVEHASALQLDERREALAKCLAKLSPGDRELLTQRYAEGATTESTAGQVGRSVHGLYKALARIRRALFNCVTEQLLTEGAL